MKSKLRIINYKFGKILIFFYEKISEIAPLFAIDFCCCSSATNARNLESVCADFWFRIRLRSSSLNGPNLRLDFRLLVSINWTVLFILWAILSSDTSGSFGNA